MKGRHSPPTWPSEEGASVIDRNCDECTGVIEEAYPYHISHVNQPRLEHRSVHRIWIEWNATCRFLAWEVVVGRRSCSAVRITRLWVTWGINGARMQMRLQALVHPRPDLQERNGQQSQFHYRYEGNRYRVPAWEFVIKQAQEYDMHSNSQQTRELCTTFAV